MHWEPGSCEFPAKSDWNQAMVIAKEKPFGRNSSYYVEYDNLALQVAH